VGKTINMAEGVAYVLLLCQVLYLLTHSRAISSEVVLPESEHEQPDVPRAAKRRQSSSSDHSTKRARLSTDGDIDLPSAIRASPSNSPKAPESANPSKKDTIRERRQSDAQEERRRGRRLFGGLLNTLSQSASNTQQKRRLEIETRQQEKARLQKAEDESRRAERLQKLKEVRMREQVKFDEQSVRLDIVESWISSNSLV
jgi:hypothetical protein